MTNVVIDTKPVWGNMLPQLKWKDGTVVISEDDKHNEPYGIGKFFNFKEDFTRLYFKAIVNNPRERKTIEALISLPRSVADVCNPGGVYLGGRTLVDNVAKKFATIKASVDANGKVGYDTSDLERLGVRCRYYVDDLVKDDALMRRILLENKWKSKYPALVKPYEEYQRSKPKTIVLPTNRNNPVRSNVDIKPVNPPSSKVVKTVETDERLKDPPHTGALKTLIPLQKPIAPVQISEKPVVVKPEIKSPSKVIQTPDPQTVVAGKIIPNNESADSRSLFGSPVLLICVASLLLLIIIL
ncbi:hypothetical protein [Heliothis virescens ascovirus 3e]|uniref:Uncharacterized protein ORF18 n=1 Tax=Heliothis virescens ascovirus 3e TaxID=260797 RepID=Y018_HVAVE|nr:hypothetical protein HVAV3e_gp017 [Heliothis virescens ascovirus 3e]A4KX73.1 RecName: Full=Uncharacterized protein ORF18 [Heliothis virescens ascovirus 3e]ABO37204.1 hypothetical protein [Heliothis virescens ascovirus 3e]